MPCLIITVDVVERFLLKKQVNTFHLKYFQIQLIRMGLTVQKLNIFLRRNGTKGF